MSEIKTSPEATRQWVQQILIDSFGTARIDRDGDFLLPFESTTVFVRVAPFIEDMTVVILTAVLGQDVPPSPELFKFIATEASKPMFGSLSAIERQDTGTVTVYLRHTLLGDTLDANELQNAIGTVGVGADYLDDIIVSRFGGRRFHDESEAGEDE